MKGYILIILLSVLCWFQSCKAVSYDEEKHEVDLNIPTRGNSWVVNNIDQNGELIGEDGITNWTNPETRIRTYFKLQNKGELYVALLAKYTDGVSTIKVSCGSESKEVTIENAARDTVWVGAFHIDEPGYHWVELQGIKREAATFPVVKSVLIGGEATAGSVYFVNDEFYWGRRGPSVHLNYQVPENTGDVEWFYNEITVPENSDVLGSYFMADGFGQGYFGMQVNSPTERRILFSVWSPYQTDNPGEIPDEYKIRLLKKGEDVHTGEFGNEGSGGQSYLVFPWKSGVTYRFLLRGKPTGKGETDFTAWFFAPETGEWKLVASFRRPKTDNYLVHLHSFLENFLTETGNITRKAKYTNQWACTKDKKWIELTKVKFTADATARKESRMDYWGGTEDGAFVLKNCGFFNETAIIDSYFERDPIKVAPQISFDELP